MLATIGVFWCSLNSGGHIHIYCFLEYYYVKCQNTCFPSFKYMNSELTQRQEEVTMALQQLMHFEVV